MPVGIESGKWLQDGRRHLKDQRDDANLGKRELKLILDDGIDRRDNRLNHIVEEMGYAANHQHGIDRTLGHGGMSFDYATYRFHHHWS